MIIACPACATRYEVPESAVGPDGRTVRCAKCRHSWFEDGSADLEGLEASAELEDGRHSPAAAENAVPSDAEALRETAEAQRADAQPQRRIGATQLAAAEETPGEEISAPPPPAAAMPVAHRSRWRLWSWAAVILAVLGGATAAAASYWGLPDWMPVQRPTMASNQPGLKLNFPADRQERRQLPNGTEFFGASGTITNVDDEAQPVPPILIVLRDERDRIVFSWEVAPPKRSLAPGESITVNEAMTDVPRSARVAEIGWKPV